ncbi:ABC transporter ATP-binding protein [Celeribacter ethanolicus]|uniref:ABC transporter ATP-binding protein n=1 Tax=Celeribacter ethanolicus TaxID=1758178 RepID=A0A291G815_9RHOB|nr:ABC transporter ATP-binding protein [Celeribacter ethanolicus]ATG46166.1 ABC transporter ATP-binding protein [Celeribacter ethanolicus]
MPLIEARNVTIRIPTEDGGIHAANSVSFSVEEGELFGIAGESGSGKSVLMQAIAGLLPGAEIEGEVLFNGRDMLTMSEAERRALRGAQIGMIFQDPLSSLHPFYTIGSQIAEMIHAHEKVDKAEARRRVVEMLERVGIAEADKRYDAYPHEFSGGMRQRVMIAMALILRPPLIIADEPTTALDVTVQAQIVELLDEMRRSFGTTVIMITHDLGLLSSVADHVMVMYAGTRLEIGATEALFAMPAHPYTLGLLRSSPAADSNGSPLIPIAGKPPSLLARPRGCVFAPRCAQASDLCHTTPPPLRRYSDATEALCHFTASLPEDEPVTEQTTPPAASRTSARYVVEASGLSLTYRTKKGFGRAVENHVLNGVDLTVRKGETLGLVGESGCGKSTLARVLAGLAVPTDGEVKIQGEPIASLTAARWREMRRRVQMVFQDPFGSLNPRRRVGAIISDPMRIHNIGTAASRKARVQELMEIVGLNPEHFNRFPSEFSGGQRQRIGIARALALEPALIILDEPVSALDVSIQAQILNLLQALQRELGLTYLFISHDLSVVRHICDRIAVMDKGQIVESSTSEQLFRAPAHPFTRELLGATHHPPALTGVDTRHLISETPFMTQEAQA